MDLFPCTKEELRAIGYKDSTIVHSAELLVSLQLNFLELDFFVLLRHFDSLSLEYGAKQYNLAC